jgi:hypothetical protein
MGHSGSEGAGGDQGFDEGVHGVSCFYEAMVKPEGGIWPPVNLTSLWVV